MVDQIKLAKEKGPCGRATELTENLHGYTRGFELLTIIILRDTYTCRPRRGNILWDFYPPPPPPPLRISVRLSRVATLQPLLQPFLIWSVSRAVLGSKIWAPKSTPNDRLVHKHESHTIYYTVGCLGPSLLTRTQNPLWPRGRLLARGSRPRWRGVAAPRPDVRVGAAGRAHRLLVIPRAERAVEATGLGSAPRGSLRPGSTAGVDVYLDDQCVT
jgi:hypothetical protein